MRNQIRLSLVFAFAPLLLTAKSIDLKVYPPEVRLHAHGEGQTVLVVVTDDEGVSRDVTAETSWRMGDSSLALSKRRSALPATNPETRL